MFTKTLERAYFYADKQYDIQNLTFQENSAGSASGSEAALNDLESSSGEGGGDPPSNTSSKQNENTPLGEPLKEVTFRSTQHLNIVK